MLLWRHSGPAECLLFSRRNRVLTDLSFLGRRNKAKSVMIAYTSGCLQKRLGVWIRVLQLHRSKMKQSSLLNGSVDSWYRAHETFCLNPVPITRQSFTWYKPLSVTRGFRDRKRNCRLSSNRFQYVVIANVSQDSIWLVFSLNCPCVLRY